MRARIHVRHLLFGLLAALIAVAAPAASAAETGFAVILDTSQSQPRHVEETTMASVNATMAMRGAPWLLPWKRTR